MKIVYFNLRLERNSEESYIHHYLADKFAIAYNL